MKTMPKILHRTLLISIGLALCLNTAPSFAVKLDTLAATSIPLTTINSMARALSLDAATEQDARFDKLSQAAMQNGNVPVIVKLQVAFAPEGVMEQDKVNLQRASIQYLAENVVSALGLPSSHVKRFETVPFVALRVTSAQLEQLKNTPGVTDIQEDSLSKPTLNESVALIGGNTAHASGWTGAGQTIAVLDTGIEKSHPFLSGKVVSEACYSSTFSSFGSTSLCPGGAASSTASNSGLNCTATLAGCDHGTHVAGIAVGRGSNMSGVAPQANLIAVQIFSRFPASYCGSTDCILTYDSDQIKALERVYALRTSFKIAAVNMSIGGGMYTSTCDSTKSASKAAIDNLRSVGIATVISSGNNAYSDALSAPACISSAVSVGSTGDGSSGAIADIVSRFSNSASFLDLLAPGQVINSSILNGAFANKQGTSMAAPHVAGAFALLKQRYPTENVDQLENRLKTTGKAIVDTRNNISVPRVDLAKALASGNPIDDNRFFVAQLYSDFLGRTPNSAEVNGWLDQLNAGSITRPNLVNAFFSSTEHQQYIPPIARLYFAFFKRIPDYGGLEHWKAQQKNGMTLGNIAQLFAESQEFKNTYGGLSNTAYVELLYQNVLGRSPDPSGLAHWVNQLNSGVSRGSVMLGFSESQEYKTRSNAWVQVSMMYHSMLRRQAEQSGFDHWVNRMRTGVSITELISGFINSQEYRKRFGT